MAKLTVLTLKLFSHLIALLFFVGEKIRHFHNKNEIAASVCLEIYALMKGKFFAFTI